jgi:hypothetical protein
MIARINDMSGGLHDDIYFPELWEMGKAFLARGIYGVYTPWVDGITNFNWIYNKLNLLKYTGRLFVDIEVKYPNYSPTVYAGEVAKFILNSKANWPTTIYTGEWFLSTLSAWSTIVDYWWASYPSKINGCLSWELYKQLVETLPFGSYNADKCPGKISIHQISGDNYKPIGAGGAALDTNIFLGTEKQLEDYFCMNSTPDPNPPIDIKEQLKTTIGELSALIEQLP